MTAMLANDLTAYLQRIAYDGPVEPTWRVLRSMHLAHLRAVPFENLDIHYGRPIVLDEEQLLRKIVQERRGGFCYELNGAFAALLRAIGFRVSLLSAGVARGDGTFGPEFDHLLLRVDLDEPWLADVGFGDSFLEPIPLSAGVHEQDGQAFRLEHDGPAWTFSRLEEDRRAPQHRFTLTPRVLGEFAPMCRFHQTSPDSHFTRNRICSRATPEGRVSLSNDRLIVTDHAGRHEVTVGDEADWHRLLIEHFGIDFSMVTTAEPSRAVP